MIKHTNKQVRKKRILLNIYKYINQSFVRNFQHVNETNIITQLYLEDLKTFQTKQRMVPVLVKILKFDDLAIET